MIGDAKKNYYLSEETASTKLIDPVNSEAEENGFRGELHKISLLSLLEILLNRTKEVKLAVNCPESGVKGNIFIRNHEIIGAEFGNLKGKEAFAKMISLKKGIATLTEFTQPKEISLDLSEKDLLEKLKWQNSKKTNQDLQQKIKVLLLDQNKKNCQLISKYFSDHGFSCQAVFSAGEAEQILTRENFDFIITETKTRFTNEQELISWLNRNSPETQTIVIDYSSGTDGELTEKNGALKFFSQPLNLKKISDFISYETKNEGFSFVIKNFKLTDILKIIVSSLETKIIEIQEQLGKKSGIIYLKKGELFHAEMDLLKGEKAFYELIKLKKGIFLEKEVNDLEERTIEKNFWELLLNNHNKKENQEKVEQINPPINNQNDLSIINEQESSILGLKINKTHLKEIFKKMKEVSLNEPVVKGDIISFSELGIDFYLEDRSKILKDITVYPPFSGKTLLGLELYDDIEKAIQLYGEPFMETNTGAMWEKFSVFLDEGKIINSIRLSG